MDGTAPLFDDSDLVLLDHIFLRSPSPSRPIASRASLPVIGKSSSDEDDAQQEPFPKKPRTTSYTVDHLNCDANLQPVALDGPTLDLCQFGDYDYADAAEAEFDLSDVGLRSPLASSNSFESFPIINRFFQVVKLAQVVTFNSVIQIANQEFAELVGASRSDAVIGKNVMEFIPPAFQFWVRHNLETNLQDSGKCMVQFPTVMGKLDGSCFMAVLQFSLFQDHRQGYQQAMFTVDCSTVRQLSVPTFVPE